MSNVFGENELAGTWNFVTKVHDVCQNHLAKTPVTACKTGIALLDSQAICEMRTLALWLEMKPSCNVTSSLHFSILQKSLFLFRCLHASFLSCLPVLIHWSPGDIAEVSL